MARDPTATTPIATAGGFSGLGVKTSWQACLQWTDGAGLLQGFVFDNVLSEEWTNEATATEHPVEKGASISDHVRVELPECTLTVHSTNEPLAGNQFQDGQRLALTLASPPTGPTRSIGVSATALEVDIWQNNIAINAAINAIGTAIGEAAGDAVGENPGGTKPGDILGRKLTAALQGARDANAFAQSLGIAIQQLDIDGQLGFPVQSAGDLVAIGIEAAAFALNLPAFAIPTIQIAEAGLPAAPPAVPAIATTLQYPAGLDFVEETVAALVKLLRDVQLVTLNGTKQQEKDMAVTSVAHTRSSEEGSGATITLKFRQIRIVATKVVAAPIPALTRAQPPVNKGAQNPQDGSAADQVTTAAALVDNAAALIKRAKAALFGGGA